VKRSSVRPFFLVMASREAGGGRALLGISWLPLVFGPLFTARIRSPGAPTWPLLKRLLKLLVVYGWTARLPVVAVTLVALGFEWDTHFNSFGPNGATMSLAAKIGATLGAQLIFWAVIWTPIVGGLSGVAFHWIKRRGERIPSLPDRSLRTA